MNDTDAQVMSKPMPKPKLTQEFQNAVTALLEIMPVLERMAWDDPGLIPNELIDLLREVRSTMHMARWRATVLEEGRREGFAEAVAWLKEGEQTHYREAERAKNEGQVMESIVRDEQGFSLNEAIRYLEWRRAGGSL